MFARLRPGSFFINTARAEVVDYNALEQAVREKNIRVALDVYPDEPSTGPGISNSRSQSRRVSTAPIMSAHRRTRRRKQLRRDGAHYQDLQGKGSSRMW